MLYYKIAVNKIPSYVVLCSLPDSEVNLGAFESSSLFRSPLQVRQSAKIIYTLSPIFRNLFC